MDCFSLREKEGYLRIDHRDSPGISAEQAKAMRSHVVVPGGTMLEARTYNCCACQRTVIINPDRLRTRDYCRECHSYMCETCALLRKLTGIHRPMKRFVAEYLESAAKGPAALAHYQLQQTIYEAQRKQAQELIRRTYDGS